MNDLTQANKIIKMIKNRDSVIFTDASYVNIPNGASSAGAFVIILRKKDHKANILSWSLTKIKCVVKSTIAAKD